MATGPSQGATSELEQLRREYESAASRRVTRSLRALSRRARSLRATATSLASTHLSARYLLALGRSAFIWVLGAGVLAEVTLVLLIGADLTAVALALLAVQAVCAAAVLVLSLGHSSPEVAAEATFDPLSTTDEADLVAPVSGPR